MKSSDPFESVASVLEGSILGTVEAWLERVEIDKMIMAIPLSREKRTGHIPQLLINLVNRLRLPSPLGADAKELVSIAAERHGQLRWKQGYSAAMLVEESRMFQVSVFETLHLTPIASI